MKPPYRRFSFPAVAAAIIAVLLLTVIAAHARITFFANGGRVERVTRHD